MAQITIDSLLNQISFSTNRLKDVFSEMDELLPPSFKGFSDDYCELYQEVNGTDGNDYTTEEIEECKSLLEKVKSIIVMYDFVMPISFFLQYYNSHYKPKKYVDDLLERAIKFDKLVTIEEAYEFLQNEPTELINELFVRTDNYVSLKQSFGESKEAFILACKHTKSGLSDLLYICGLLQEHRSQQSLSKQFDSLSEDSSRKVWDDYLSPTIRRMYSGEEIPFSNLPFSYDKLMKLDISDVFPTEEVMSLARDVYDGLLLALQDGIPDSDLNILKNRIQKNDFLIDLFWGLQCDRLYDFGGLEQLDSFIDTIKNNEGEDSRYATFVKNYREIKLLELQDNENRSTQSDKVPVIVGRKTGCWIKNGSRSDEDSWAQKIEQKLWNPIHKLVCQFKLGKQTEFQLKKIRKELTAAIIYKATTIAGISEEWGYGVQSSFERTMKFVSIDRRSLERYMMIVDRYMIMKEYQIEENKTAFPRVPQGEIVNSSESVDDYVFEDNEIQYGRVHFKQLFPNSQDRQQMRRNRDLLMQDLNKADREMLSENFNAIGRALSATKKILRNIS